MGGKPVDPALLVNIHIVAFGRRVADNAEGEFHLVELGIGQFQKKNRILIVRPGTDFDPHKR